MRYTFYYYTKVFCLNFFLCFCKLSLAKELSEIIFNFSMSFSVSFLFDFMCHFFFFFCAALSISGLVGFEFILRVRSPFAGRLLVTKL